MKSFRTGAEKRLTALTAGATRIAYAYDMNGVRSRKTVSGVAHDYVTQNGRVIQERYGTTVLQFVYGTDGNPYAMRYSENSGSTWQTFYYILNLQGDVAKLVDANGTVCAEYSYDAWGKCLSQTTAASCAVANLADKNPIRYRGYYYDTETGWYYLQSRYYDPIVKRFINADSYATTPTGYTGCNMFAYCNNNPVNNRDDLGTLDFYTVDNITTEQLDDDNEEPTYVITINYTFDYMDYNNPAVHVSFNGEASFKFSVDYRGIIIYDNSRQSSAYLMEYKSISLAVASEMYNTAQKLFPGTLAGRTVSGIARELRVHYKFSSVIPIKRIVVADMGGMKKKRPDYDYNAKVFESPYNPMSYVKMLWEMLF